MITTLVVSGLLALGAASGLATASGPTTASALAGQRPPTLEQLMADSEWIGRLPENPAWAHHGLSVFFDRKLPGCEDRERIELVLATGEERTVEDDELASIDATPSARSRDGHVGAWARGGDLFVRDLSGGRVRRITATSEAETDPLFLLDGRLAFRRGARHLARDLGTGLESEIVALHADDHPDRAPEPQFLRDQQRRLFEVLSTRSAREAQARRREAERAFADPARPPQAVHLGKGDVIRRSDLSPDGRHVLVVLGPEAEEGPKETMPTWVTASGHVETREMRAKVGAGKPARDRLVLVDATTGTFETLDVCGLPLVSDDPLKALRHAADERRRAADDLRKARQDEKSEKGTLAEGQAEEHSADAHDRPEHSSRKGRSAHDEGPRPLAITDVAWSPDGSRCAVQLRSRDNKDRWIALAVPGEKKLTPVTHVRDQAWINWRFDEMGWLPDGAGLWWLTEENGRSQLWLRQDGDKAPRALTGKGGEASSVTITRDGRFAWFRSNDPHPGIQEIFRIDLRSGRVEQVTQLGGQNDYLLSPQEDQLLVTHSGSLEPPELYLQDAEPGAHATRLTQSESEAFLATRWNAPEFIAIPSTHGAGFIHARIWRPPSGAPRSGAAGWPAVFFIHGAGYLQDAHQGWSGYFRETLFNSLLADRGLVVVDLDYRASAGYGRDWRTAIHLDMGRPELEDHADAIAWIARTEGVDRRRVGAYGGSYGGFLVLMAMLREPDLLACGAALRPVTDWAHYNHPYTSNILETPELAPEAYRRSSPIEFAAGLSRPLLICAPMLDDNVPFQDTVRLAQRFIELGRPSFEVALYPVEPHGFREPSSWLDEYRRILALFERHLLSSCPMSTAPDE